MPFFDLTPDVVAIVVSHLSWRRRDVVNFSLTCWAAYAHGRRPEYVELNLDRFAILSLDSKCTNDPEFGHRVRTLNMFKAGATNHSPTAMNGFLRHMPNVQTLSISFATVGLLPPSRSLLPSNVLGLGHSLRKLQILRFELEAHDLTMILSLPRLDTIDLGGSLIIEPNKYGVVKSSPSRLRVLQAIYIKRGCHTSMSLELLGLTLQRCPLLRCLQISVELPRIAWSELPPDQRPSIDNCTFLKAGLLSTRHSLSRLEISALNTKSRESYYDGSRLDLSLFTALKSLKGSAELFVPQLSPKTSGRDGFYRRLPASIEEVMLEFPLWMGIFYDIRSDSYTENRRRVVINTIGTAAYNWIWEVARHKLMYPGLLSLVLSEFNNDRYNEEIWRRPPDIAIAFMEARIELQVTMRVKRRPIPSLYEPTIWDVSDD